jgi:hypothetical protein
MKRSGVWLLLPLVLVVGASLTWAPSAWSVTFDVDRTDDTAAATACTAAPNDCSLRGAIMAANADPGLAPVIINLQPATTYHLTLTNAAQENGAATGDLDITTTLHPVTIVGGGSSGPGATVIDTAGLNIGSLRDRVLHLTGAGVTVVLQNLAVRNGVAADDGTSGASTDPTAQNANRAGGCILNNGGTLTLTNVAVESCQAAGKGDSVINAHTTLDALGGGLASLGATGNVVITDSTLTGNTAAGGNGGNFNNGAGSGARGGSIYFEGGTLVVTGTRIEASAATGGLGGSVDQDGQTNGGFGGSVQGGGVWIGGGTATITASTFESTVATGGNSGTGGNASNPGGNAEGGGLYSLGSVTVNSSTFHLAAAVGGHGGDAFGSTCLGAHNGGDGGGARGGAIFAGGGALIVDTSTFASNAATGGHGGDGGQTNGGLNCGMHGAGGLAHGGAIASDLTATVNVKHATISGNSAQAGNTGVNQGGANKPPRLVAEGTGGGIRVGPGGVTLQNTIIAVNTAANGTGDTTGAPTPGPDVDGAVISNGHNLLGVATAATGFTGVGDQVGVNPMLAPLADNGGPTETMELLAGSPAIDAGVAAGAAFDQRGRPRAFDDPGVTNVASGDGTDIGAFERQPDCTLTCPADVIESNDPGQCGGVVDYPAPTGPGCGVITCDHPSGSFFPLGATPVTCTSSEGPVCGFNVTVNDTQAPVLTTNLQTITLWPPNHKYRTIDVADLVASASDNCDPGVVLGSVRIDQVTSDEPNQSAGSGNTTNDVVIAPDCTSVQLRSERKGNGNGRVYTITFEVTDAANNVSTATAKVTVPHSQNGSPALDDGPAYTVTSSCP